MSTFDQPQKEEIVPHYYGDIVRRLFLAIVILMVISMPFFLGVIGSYLQVSILAIVALSLLAGLTNPRSVLVLVIDQGAAVLGFIVFEYMATTSYANAGVNVFFYVNQIIAVLFLVAIYFVTKSLRGMRKGL